MTEPYKEEFLEPTASSKKFYDLKKDEEERVKSLHSNSLIVDALTVCEITDEQLNRMLDVGVTAINKTTNEGFFYDTATKKITETYRWLREFNDKIFLATTAEDVKKAKKEKKIAYFIGFQDAMPIENNLGLLEVFYNLGVRIIQITYNWSNLIGFGSGESRDFGLTDFGKEVISEMNRLGIIVDLGHVGKQTTLEAIELSKAPAFVSHANVQTLANSPRNKTDEEIHAVDEKNGVINIYDSCFIINEDRGKKPSELKGTVKDYVKHITYVVDLVGVDHVGIGMDLSEGRKGVKLENVLSMRYKYNHLYPTPRIRPEGLRSYSEMPNITRGLVAEGYSDTEIKKILGLNNLRVYKEVFGK